MDFLEIKEKRKPGKRTGYCIYHTNSFVLNSLGKKGVLQNRKYMVWVPNSEQFGTWVHVTEVCSPWGCGYFSGSVQKSHSVVRKLLQQKVHFVTGNIFRKWYMQLKYSWSLLWLILRLSLLVGDHELIMIIVVRFLLISHVGFASIKEAQDSCRRERWGQFRYRRIKNVVE